MQAMFFFLVSLRNFSGDILMLFILFFRLEQGTNSPCQRAKDDGTLKASNHRGYGGCAIQKTTDHKKAEGENTKPRRDFLYQFRVHCTGNTLFQKNGLAASPERAAFSAMTLSDIS